MRAKSKTKIQKDQNLKQQSPWDKKLLKLIKENHNEQSKKTLKTNTPLQS